MFVCVDTQAPQPPTLLSFLAQNYEALGLKPSSRVVKRADYDVVMRVYENGAGECFNYVQEENNTTEIVLLVDSPLPSAPGWIMDIIDQYRRVVGLWGGDQTFQVTFMFEYDAENSSMSKSA